MSGFDDFIAIDPGTEESALVLWSEGMPPDLMGIFPNAEARHQIAMQALPVVIEGISSYGMAVGASTFETVFWSGRFAEAAPAFDRVYRKDVKLHLCQSMRAKDPNVRQALIDRFGGTKRAAIGLKATPGPLYGIKSHLWSALAVAVTYADTHLLAEQAAA